MLLVLAVIIIIAVAIIVVNETSVLKYYNANYGRINAERRELAKNIYAGHTESITKILLSESKSEIIHWAFISEEAWDSEEEQQILDELFEYMQKRGPRFPVNWEVYFCQGKTVKSGYVSTYGDDATINEKDSFTEWYSIPNAENLLTYDMLIKIMKRPAYTLYSFGPNDSRIPMLPDW